LRDTEEMGDQLIVKINVVNLGVTKTFKVRLFNPENTKKSLIIFKDTSLND